MIMCHARGLFTNRMLADLRLVQCYNMTAMTRDDRDRAILESAKNNLEQVSDVINVHVGRKQFGQILSLKIRKTSKNCRQNIFWAIKINIIT
jgi:hypothetical protein